MKTSVEAFALDYQFHQFTHSIAIHADCFEWMSRIPAESLHAIVTDPPYGVKEYNFEQIENGVKSPSMPCALAGMFLLPAMLFYLN